jgi:CO/xanthine dehydrogenase FAD-binding subunit
MRSTPIVTEAREGSGNALPSWNASLSERSLSVQVLRPRDLAEALAFRRDRECLPLAGGTDVMVELNFDRRRPDAILDLGQVEELRGWSQDADEIRVGAGVTYLRLQREVAPAIPGLALAARTVGSPQIRNRGTIGGNLGAASPAGDCHPPLLAIGAEVELRSPTSTRRVPADEFFVGPKLSVLRSDELITAVLVPTARGPQQFAKVGTRNAMVIAVCSFGLALDLVARRVGTGIGSAGPTPLRAREAEDYLGSELDESAAWHGGGGLSDSAVGRFGELVAAAASPIDDVRGTAAYRRRALSVLAQRTLRWSLAELEQTRAA